MIRRRYRTWLYRSYRTRKKYAKISSIRVAEIESRQANRPYSTLILSFPSSKVDPPAPDGVEEVTDPGPVNGPGVPMASGGLTVVDR